MRPNRNMQTDSQTKDSPATLRCGDGFGSEAFADRYFCPSCRHDFDACDSVFALPTGPAVECDESTPGRATACPRCFYTFPEYY